MNTEGWGEEPDTSIKKFIIKKEDLLKLCRDTISGQLEPEDLHRIAVVINNSKYFELPPWIDGGVVLEMVLEDWEYTKDEFPITVENVKNRWKIFLELGKHGPHYP